MLSFSLYNCSFASETVNTLISLHNVGHFKIFSCIFTTKIKICQEGCAIFVKGYNSQTLEIDLLGWRRWESALIDIENMTFKGLANLISGEFISLKNLDLRLENSAFEISAKNTGQSTGGILHYDGSRFYGRNIVLDATKLNAQEVSALSIYDSSTIEVHDVHIYCSQESLVTEITKLSSHVVSCVHICEPNQYLLQRGHVTLNGTKVKGEYQTLSRHKKDPQCLNCPTGANCGQVIKAMPNYWGYQSQSDNITRITMIRCPVGYCCTGNKSCNGINSCNVGRKGILCASCNENLTESLFTAECVSVKSGFAHSD